jgi:hypothetical protein
VGGKIDKSAFVNLKSSINTVAFPCTKYHLHPTTANQITLAHTPAITANTDGMAIRFKAANNNTAATQIHAGPELSPLSAQRPHFRAAKSSLGNSTRQSTARR